MSTRVLIVDDDAAIGQLISTILTAEGYQADTTTTYPEALSLMQQHDYGVIFSDIRLGQSHGGLDILKTATTLAPFCKVIMMTGYPDVTTAIKAVRNGAFDYLCKPFDSLQISSITRHAAENRRLQLEQERLREIGRASCRERV